jgi:cyclase
VLKARLIPCLLLRDGVLVRSETFSVHQAIGYPLNEVQRFNQWTVDELIYLDISREDSFDLALRPDHKVEALASPLDVLEAIARGCFIPLTFGGRIRDLGDMEDRFRRGADKIAVNTAAVAEPTLLTDAARRFGSQAIVASIDARVTGSGWEVFVDGGRTPTGLDPAAWAADVERLGAGEIFLNSIDRDGTGEGFDLELIRRVTTAVDIPVIACGGVGRYEDFAPAITEGGASAVSAANIFHFKELSDRNAKRTMQRAGVNVRFEPAVAGRT